MAKQRLKELHIKMQQERLRRIRAEQIQEMGGTLEKEKKGENDEKMEEEEKMPTTSSALKEKEGGMEEFKMEQKPPNKFEYDPTVFVQPEGLLPPHSTKTLMFTFAEMLKMEDEQREQAYL